MTVNEYEAIHEVIRPGKHRYKIICSKTNDYGTYIFAKDVNDLECKWMNYCIENGFNSNAIIDKITIDDII